MFWSRLQIHPIIVLGHTHIGPNDTYSPAEIGIVVHARPMHVSEDPTYV